GRLTCILDKKRSLPLPSHCGKRRGGHRLPVLLSGRIGAPVDRIHRTRQGLRVALHFRRKSADLSRVSEVSAFIGDNADRYSHQRNSMQLTATILSEEIAGSPILLRVL